MNKTRTYYCNDRLPGLRNETPSADPPVENPPAGENPTPAPAANPPQPQGRTINYNGRAVELSSEEVDQLIYAGINHLEAERNQPEPDPEPAPRGEGDKVTVESLNERIDRLTQTMTQFMQGVNVKDRAKDINTQVNDVISKSSIKDNKALTSLVRQAALVSLQENPHADVAKVVGENIKQITDYANSERQSYINKKREQLSARGVPMDSDVPTNNTPLKGADLLNGKVRSRAKNRLAASLFED